MESASTVAQKATPRVEPLQVVVTYQAGAEEGDEFVVTGYPPANLQEGEKIEFQSDPPGRMVLVFPYGSNFSNDIPDVVISDANGKVIKTVERIMTYGEKNTLLSATGIARPDFTFSDNAFPFKCFLARKLSNRVSTEQGGFPPPPHSKGT